MIKWYRVSNIIEYENLEDLESSSNIEGEIGYFIIPKFYQKIYYSISASVHKHLV